MQKYRPRTYRPKKTVEAFRWLIDTVPDWWRKATGPGSGANVDVSNDSCAFLDHPGGNLCFAKMGDFIWRDETGDLHASIPQKFLAAFESDTVPHPLQVLAKYYARIPSLRSSLGSYLTAELVIDELASSIAEGDGSTVPRWCQGNGAPHIWFTTIGSLPAFGGFESRCDWHPDRRKKERRK